MPDSTPLDRLARRQHGLVTTQQCLAAGLTLDQIRRRTGSHALIPVRHGVYRWCGSDPTWEMMAMAAVLAMGKGATLSHHSAAHVWALLADAPDELELTGPKQLRTPGVISHRHLLTAAETTFRRRLPVTTAARTLLDLAETVPARSLGPIVDEALRRRIVTLAGLEAIGRAHAGVGRRRMASFREVLRERGVGYDPGANDGEKRMDRLWDELGLPPAEKQYQVRIGRRTYVLDRAIPHLMIGVEWNGYEYHRGRSRFDHDHERRLDLMAAGWVLIEFTMRSAPARIAESVWRAVSERSTALGRPA